MLIKINYVHIYLETKNINQLQFYISHICAKFMFILRQNNRESNILHNIIKGRRTKGSSGRGSYVLENMLKQTWY